MKVLKILLSLFLFPLSFLMAEQTDFTIVFNKVETSSFYFTEADSSAVKRDAVIFSFIPNREESYTVKVGAAWNLYPSIGNSDEKLALTIEFSSKNENTPESVYMLNAVNSKGETAGMNYNVSATIENGDQTSSDSISGGSAEMSQSDRLITLFEGNVDTSGINGTAIFDLEVEHKNITVTDGTYRGYMIMSLVSN